MFPSGKHVKNGDLTKHAIDGIIGELKEKKFTGYAAFTVKTQTGIEDCNVAFENGKIANAFLENFKTKQAKWGSEAVRQITSYIDYTGFFDIVELTTEQVQLATAVRPQSEVRQVEEIQVQKPIETNEEILKKYGLSSLADTHD